MRAWQPKFALGIHIKVKEIWPPQASYGACAYVHSLGTLNSAPVNTGMQVSIVRWLSPLDVCCGCWGCIMCLVCSSFWELFILISSVAGLVYIPTRSVLRFPLPLWLRMLNFCSCSLYFFLKNYVIHLLVYWLMIQWFWFICVCVSLSLIDQQVLHPDD